MQPKNNAHEWHPVYRTISEWLAAEAGPVDLNIGRPRRREKNTRKVRTS